MTHQTPTASQPVICASLASGVGVRPPSSQKASIRNGMAAVIAISARSLIVPHGWPLLRKSPIVTSATTPAAPTTHAPTTARRTFGCTAAS